MANTENILGLPDGYELHKRYKLEKILGAGGFGITYKAKDKLNKTFCCVKEYVPLGICARYGNGVTLTATGEESKSHFDHGKMRFMEEAKALLEVASIPNIVRVMDYFEENGTAYYVMEYLSGVTAKELRKNYPDKKMPFDIAFQIISIVGASLHKVHDRYHLLHRDISPDNIFVTKEGVVKLIDFGSAKHICRNGNQKFTVVIKEGYAPPEQYRQNYPQGPYTDVYALASTFYYLICGKMLPTSMERVAGTTYQPAYELAPGVTRQMSAVLDKALHTDYKRRYQTVGAFIAELTEAYRMSQQSAPAPVDPSKPVPKPEEDGPKTPDDGRSGASGGKKGRGQDKGPTTAPTPPPKPTPDPPKPEPGNGGGGQIKGIGNIAIYVYERNKIAFTYRFPEDAVIGIGRTRDGNDIVIPGYRQISRCHCYVQYDPAGHRFLVKNMSTNGTFYKGKLLKKESIYAVPIGECIDLAGVCKLKLGDK